MYTHFPESADAAILFVDAQAEQVYKEDLTINPHNGWSLTGVAVALDKQNKRPQYNKAKAEAVKAFSRADVKITNSVF